MYVSMKDKPLKICFIYYLAQSVLTNTDSQYPEANLTRVETQLSFRAHKNYDNNLACTLIEKLLLFI